MNEKNANYIHANRYPVAASLNLVQHPGGFTLLKPLCCFLRDILTDGLPLIAFPAKKVTRQSREILRANHHGLGG